jgi:hypothetical protein
VVVLARQRRRCIVAIVADCQRRCFVDWPAHPIDALRPTTAVGRSSDDVASPTLAATSTGCVEIGLVTVGLPPSTAAKLVAGRWTIGSANGRLVLRSYAADRRRPGSRRTRPRKHDDDRRIEGRLEQPTNCFWVRQSRPRRSSYKSKNDEFREKNAILLAFK